MIEERTGIIEFVRRWGGSASDAILDKKSKIFKPEDIEGLIGYRIAHECAVVLGDPVCAPDKVPDLAQAFHKYCAKNSIKNIIYLTATEDFSKLALQNNICKAKIEFGQELFIDPHSDPQARKGVNASLVRRKVRHALKENAEVHEYTSDSQELKKALEEVAASWLKKRQGPQVFTSHVNLFENAIGKRWFFATQNNKVVGVLSLNQLKAREGWLLNHIMFTPEASGGIPELLVTTTMEKLSQEGCHFITMGPVPGKELGKIEGFNKMMTWVAPKFYNLMTKVLKLEGRSKFWEKFHPESSKLFVLFSDPKIGLREIRALMNTINADSKT